jgi:sodium/proline symporter
LLNVRFYFLIITLFWKRFHGVAALITVIAGMSFTIFWITSGLEKQITLRMLTFFVALVFAVLSTFIFKPKKRGQ